MATVSSRLQYVDNIIFHVSKDGITHDKGKGPPPEIPIRCHRLATHAIWCPLSNRFEFETSTVRVQWNSEIQAI